VNSATGSFVLVDPHTHATVAAGMIRGPVTRIAPAHLGRPPGASPPVSPDVVWEAWNIDRATRETRTGHRAIVVWFTGMSGAGKSTIARALERALFARGHLTMLLDGDQVRHGLCGDLGFSPADRRENIRRVGEVAKLFFEQGSVVLCSFVSPFRADREGARRLFPDGRFVEVHVHAALEVLRERDPKGLYAREARREVSMSGSGAPYEPPPSPEIDIDTAVIGVERAVEIILEHLGPRLAGTRPEA
jgi:bifunctional enzyme CysN/CysC